MIVQTMALSSVARQKFSLTICGMSMFKSYYHTPRLLLNNLRLVDCFVQTMSIWHANSYISHIIHCKR